MPPVSRTRRSSSRPAPRRTGSSWGPIKLRAWWRTARNSVAWRRGFMIAGGVVLLGAAGIALEPSGGFSGLGTQITDHFARTAGTLGLKVERITVRGRLHTDPRQILAAIEVHRGDPILGVDPYAVRERLKTLNWVAEAQVVRMLPNALHIEITERRPFALWQREGRLTLIDRSGQPISDQTVPETVNLPLVVGEGAATQAAGLLDMLGSEPDLYRRVRAAVWVGQRRWNVRLANGIDVRLPEQDPAGAWRRLARVESEHQLLEREVRAVDLRIPDRLVVQLNGEAADRRRNPGEDT